MRAMFPAAPDEADSEVTEDGTACHWLAAELWEGRHHAEGTLSPNGRVLTEEMFDACDMYHDVLRSWGEAYPVCEKKIPLDIILQGMAGTPDAWAYHPPTKTLYIADLKFGFRFVEVWDNWQMLCYAFGLVTLLQLWGQDITIVFTVVQPRARHKDGPVRKWTTKLSDIVDRLTTLQEAAIRATQYVPNPGCGDCPGRHVCTALQNAALTAVHRAYEGDPNELDPAALSSELRLLHDASKKLEARITGLETQAEAILRAGKTLPHYKLSATFARETWVEGGEQAIITLAHLMKRNVAKPMRAITPNQARKIMPSNLVAIYAHKPSTGVRLTKIDPYEARKAFDK